MALIQMQDVRDHVRDYVYNMVYCIYSLTNLWAHICGIKSPEVSSELELGCIHVACR
jgi:hypothetical protein